MYDLRTFFRRHSNNNIARRQTNKDTTLSMRADGRDPTFRAPALSCVFYAPVVFFTIGVRVRICGCAHACVRRKNLRKQFHRLHFIRVLVEYVRACARACAR